jgi:hypothetical protein
VRVEEVVTHLDELLAAGRGVLLSVSESNADQAVFHAWRIRSLSFLERLLGVDDLYTRTFAERVSDTWAQDTEAGIGILDGLREDVLGGYLTNQALLIEAGVFSDFLEMADHLLAEGYKDPAASLIGAVLEDGLRKVSVARGVAIAGRPGIDGLNSALTDAKVYGALVRAQINTWRVIRNAADHAHFDEYTADDVKSMLNGVRAFLVVHNK